MNDLITSIVAGIEVIFLGSETLLQWLSDTSILGATLYAWFLGYLVLDTILSLFIPVRNDDTDDENADSFDELENKLNDPYFLEDDTAFNEFYNELSDPQIKAISLNKRKQVLNIKKNAETRAKNLEVSYLESIGKDDPFDKGYDS